MDGNNIVRKGKEVIKQCVKGGITQEVVEYAEQFGRVLKNNKLSTSQIRNVYATVKKIEMKGYKGNESEFLLLKPKLAYEAKRWRKGAEDFAGVFIEGINTIVSLSTEEKKEMAFKNFCKFFEAVLAYHRAAGGN